MTRLETPSNPEARLAQLTNELEALRSELADLRGQQPKPVIRRSRPSSAWPSAALIVAGAWVLSGQAPASIPPDIEKRLSVLEKLIRRGPGDVTQVTGPFEVVGSDGTPVLSVTHQPISSSQRLGRIHIGRGTGNNFYVKVLRGNGQLAAQMGETKEGVGSLDVYDATGQLRADVYGMNGLNVYAPGEKAVITLAPDPKRGNAGALSVMNPGGAVLASLGIEPKEGKGGALSIMNSAGTTVAVMRAMGETGALSVMNSAGKAVAGLTAGSTSGGAVVVANAGGVGLAQMSISTDGRGLVQVFGRNQNPVAVLTQATEYPGGLLQIYNSSTSVANLTVAQGGGGLLQLSGNAGVPTVEAGTLQSGRGMVRVGPQYKCNPIKPATPVIGIPGFEDCLVGSLGEK